MLKNLFPIFDINKDLIYLDNASTTQKPKILFESLNEGYLNYSFPVGRSFYKNAEDSYEIFVKSKETVSQKIFLNAEIKNIFFGSSATVVLNTIINGLKKFIKKNDSIAVMVESHNSMIAPILKLKEEIGFKLFFFDESNLNEIFDLKNLKFLFLTGTSNTTGNEIDLKKIRNLLPENVFFIVDFAQTLSYKNVNLKDLKIDFAVGSSHKMYGPYGISPFYISERLLEKIEPTVVGGGNISEINFDKFFLKNDYEKITFGSVSVPEIFAFSKVCNFLYDYIYFNERLNSFYKESMEKFNIFFKDKKNIKIISNEKSKKIFSFYIENLSSHDLAEKLALEKIFVRAGNLCSHLFFEKNKIPPIVRISLGCYNKDYEIEKTIKIIDSFL